jgi:hypothetical protein
LHILGETGSSSFSMQQEFYDSSVTLSIDGYYVVT